MSANSSVRVALYARVSTADQAKMYGLDAQREALRARAKGQGYKVVGEFVDDGVSGAREDRRELARLRALVARGGVDRILCPEVSRLSRDLRLFLDLLREFRDARVRVEFLGFPTDDTIQCETMLNMLAVMADAERKTIRERMHDRGRLPKARRGDRVCGRPPYGYTVGPLTTGDKPVRPTIPNPDEVGELRQMFEWVAADRSLRGLASDLDARGVRTRSGRPWAPTTVVAILKNPCYTGTGYYNRRQRASGTTRDQWRPESEWIPIRYPALVSQSLWDKVQGKLKANRTRFSGRPGDPSFTLRSLAGCPCGRRLNAVKKHGGRFRYYECPTRGKCGQKMHERAGDLERDVFEYVRTTFSDERKLDAEMRAFERMLAIDDVEAASAVEHARRVEAKAEREVERLLDLAVGDDMPRERIRARLAAAEARLREAKESLAEARAKLNRADAPTADALRVHVAEVRRLLRGSELADPANRGAFLRRVLTRVVIRPEEGRFECQGPLFGQAVAPATVGRNGTRHLIDVHNFDHTAAPVRTLVNRADIPALAGRSGP